MTLEEFLQVLRCHLASIEAREGPEPRGRPDAMALSLGADDTRDLIVELTRTLTESTPGAHAVQAPADLSRARRPSPASDAPLPEP